MSKHNVDQSITELYAELERLKAENEVLRKKGGNFGSGCRVSVKGAVSVYGINSLPVTLYKEPMLRLLDRADEIRAFIKAHDAELATKPANFKTIRDEANERNLESVASVMVERQVQSTNELKAIAQQQALPGMAATRVQKKR